MFLVSRRGSSILKSKHLSYWHASGILDCTWNNATPCSCCHDDRSKDTKLKAFVYTFHPDNRACLFSARYQESETLSGSSHHVVERGLAGLSYGFILATETNVRIQASELRRGFIGSVAHGKTIECHARKTWLVLTAKSQRASSPLLPSLRLLADTSFVPHSRRFFFRQCFDNRNRARSRPLGRFFDVDGPRRTLPKSAPVSSRSRIFLFPSLRFFVSTDAIRSIKPKREKPSFCVTLLVFGFRSLDKW